MKVLDCWTTRLLQFTKPGISDYGCARLWESSIFYRGLSQSEFATIGRNFFKAEITNSRSYIWTCWLKNLSSANESSRLWMWSNMKESECYDFRRLRLPIVDLPVCESHRFFIGDSHNRNTQQSRTYRGAHSKCNRVTIETFQVRGSSKFNTSFQGHCSLSKMFRFQTLLTV